MSEEGIETAETRSSSPRLTSKHKQYFDNENVEIEKEKGAYKALNDTHKQHKDEIKKSKEEDREYIDKGAFHEVYKVGKNTVVIKKIEKEGEKRDYLNPFNNAFIPALLEVCGERTIPIGWTKDKKQYSKLAKNNLFGVCEPFFGPGDNSGLTNEQKYIKTVTLFSYAMYNNIYLGSNTERTVIGRANGIYKLLPKDMQSHVIEFCSRHLFKLFLLQMHDRKPHNLLVLEDTNKNGLPVIVESDFDDLEDISCIFGKLKQNKLEQTQQTMLEKLYEKYQVLSNIKRSSLPSELKNKCNEIAEQYTMTKDKMAKLIELTTMKAKYLGFNEDKIIEKINEKIQDWKAMLQKKTTGNIVNKMAFIKEARDVTSEALNKINNKDLNEYIARIVKGTKAFQDIATKKYYTNEDNLLLNYNNVNRAELENKIEKALKAKPEARKQKLISFITNGEKLEKEHITANSLIAYFKQEPKRSRSFWWIFNQRNKRFDALCRGLEKAGIDRPENLFTNHEKEKDDEDKIRALFQTTTRQINNNKATENLDKIYNFVDQVSCCC